jgi:hypothetical protein
MTRHHHHDDCNIEHDLHKLIKLGEQIMQAIQDFVAAQNAFNDKMDIAIDDIQADIKFLNDQIAALQLTPEDQAALDALKARAQAMADKLDALDALTPPAPPIV